MKYKITWEVRKEVDIEAENEEEAMEIFWNGDYQDTEVELTSQPEIIG